MQNIRTIIPTILLILLLFNSIFLQAQTKKIVLKPGKGIQQFNDDHDNSTEIERGDIDFEVVKDSSSSVKRPVFHWRSTEQRTGENSMILDDRGMLILGSEDPCVSKYNFYKNPAFHFANYHIYIQQCIRNPYKDQVKR